MSECMASVSSPSLRPSPSPGSRPRQELPASSAWMSSQLCRLETLPAELLEKIFFHSLEVNLPRASLHIARILSQPIIYTWLIRLAFSSANNGARADFFTPDFLPALLDFWALSTTDRSRLQTSILECRWSTLSLFRQCQRDYVKHIIRKKCGDLNFSADDQCKLENLDYYLCRPMDFDLAIHGRRGSGDLVLKAKVDSADSNSSRHADLRLAFWFHFGAVQLSEPSPVSYELDVFRLPCAPSPDEPPRIPDKLLQEPWTADKLEFLTLFSHDAYIDEDNGHERTRRVLRQLIRDRDYATFEKLLGMHIKTRNYSYPQLWPVKTRHFRAALKHAEGPNDPFVRLLYYERWQTLGDHERDIKDGFMANLNLRPGSMGF